MCHEISCDIINLTSDPQINENDQTMTSMCHVEVTWKDRFLKWDNDSFIEEVDNLQMKQNDLWTPDLTVYNVVESNFHLG